MRRKNLITSVLAFAAIGGAVLMSAAGCGSSSQPVAYAPAAYGANGQCYYVNSPAEAVALQNAGLCPRSWAATLMPLAWGETYYDYYDSPAYYNTYVPARYRTVYIHTETRFGTTYRSSIRTMSKTATYRTSAGTTVKGSAITSKTRFGSGSSFGSAGTRYGGGSGRSGSYSGSSSTRSGGYGGGSGRSGGFTGRK